MTTDADRPRDEGPASIDRRRALIALGAIGAEITLGCAAGDGTEGLGDATAGDATTGAVADGSSGGVDPWPSFPSETQCTLAPDVGAGPYYFASGLERRDVREGRPGAELRLRLRVRDADCNPRSGLEVEIFQSDAGGVYSGYDNDPDRPPMLGLEPDPTVTYCRGTQVTDGAGQVEFVTLYPGWYTTRAPHIHVIVKLGDGTLHEAMVLFDHDMTVELYRSREPYSARPEMHTTNETDILAAMRAPVLELIQEGDIYWGALTMEIS